MIMKRVKYSHSEPRVITRVLSEYLTTLSQSVKYYNIYIGPYHGALPRTSKEINGGFQARVYRPLSSATTTDLTFYPNRIAARKLSGLIIIRIREKHI